jgi:hypothetical protein
MSTESTTSTIDMLHGSLRAALGINDTRVSITRDLVIERDRVGGAWHVMAIDLGGGEDHDGSITVTDPAVVAFLEQLLVLVASPQAFTKGT